MKRTQISGFTPCGVIVWKSPDVSSYDPSWRKAWNLCPFHQMIWALLQESWIVQLHWNGSLWTCLREFGLLWNKSDFLKNMFYCYYSVGAVGFQLLFVQTSAMLTWTHFWYSRHKQKAVKPASPYTPFWTYDTPMNGGVVGGTGKTHSQPGSWQSCALHWCLNRISRLVVFS